MVQKEYLFVGLALVLLVSHCLNKSERFDEDDLDSKVVLNEVRGHEPKRGELRSGRIDTVGGCHFDIESAESHHKVVPNLVWRSRPGPMRYNHMAMLDALGGNLILVFQASSGIEGVQDQHLVFSQSADEGVSWTSPQRIPVKHDGPLWSPVLHFDKERDSLWLFYAESEDCVIHKGGVKRFSPGGSVKAVQLKILEGRLGGEYVFEWSQEPQLIYSQNDGDGLPKVLANKMIVLGTGEWMLPFWSESHGSCQSKGSSGSAGVLLSPNSGSNWEKRGEIRASDTWLIENTVVEKSDGNVVMFFRTKKGFIYKSTSKDKGESWTRARPSREHNPDSKIHALRLPNTSPAWNDDNNSSSTVHPWALAYNSHKKLVKPNVRGCRTNLDIALSRDEGEKWKRVVRLEEEMDQGLRSHYPTLFYFKCKLYVAYSKFYHESRQTKSRWDLFEENENPEEAPILGIFVSTLTFS